MISKYNSASSDTGASADLPTQPSDPVLSPAPSSQNTTSRAFLMKTKGGRMVWVPEDKLDSWLKAQSDNSPEAEERRQRMADRAMQLLDQLSDRSRQQHISEYEDCIACSSPVPDQSNSSQPIQHHSDPSPTTSQARLPLNRDDCKITISSRRSRLVIIFTLLLIVGFIISCIVVSHKQSDSYLEGERSGYDSGYDVGKDEWYDKGYAEGKNASDSSSGLYIGNRNSKKYHFSTCSYLPDEANRIYFDSSSDAETSGYVPCSHCDP